MTKPNPSKEDFDALRFDMVGFIRTQIVAVSSLTIHRDWRR